MLLVLVVIDVVLVMPVVLVVGKQLGWLRKCHAALLGCSRGE